MGLIDKVLEGELYNRFLENLDEPDREIAERNVREMLKNADTIYDVLLSSLADEDGRKKLLECLSDLTSTEEGQDKWLEKS